jgi:hypothetical protein
MPLRPTSFLTPHGLVGGLFWGKPIGAAKIDKELENHV